MITSVSEENSCNNGKCGRTRKGEIHPAHELTNSDELAIEDFENEGIDIPQKIDYQRDRPLESSAQDEFKHSHYVAVLKNILRRCQTPINIGLYGSWGVGKSSILNMLKEELERKKLSKNFKYLYVDAWSLSPDSLKQEILVTLNNQLHTFSESKIEDTLYNVREEMSVSINEIWERGWPFFLGLGIIAIIGIALHYSNIINFSDFMPIPTALAVIAGAAKFFAEQSKRIIPRAASSHKFNQLYTDMIKKEKRKLVVVIDNLDRCDAAVAVNLLGLIQTFMTKHKCINILACDDQAIVNYLAEVKGKNFTEREGNEFLSKFFQVTLRIPPFIGENLEDYVTKLMGQRSIPQSGSAKHILISGAIKNPRKVNQFLNNLVAMYRLAILKEHSRRIRPETITKHIDFLTKMIVIQHEWPNFYKLLGKKNELLNEINETINNLDPKAFFLENYELIKEEWNDEGLKEFLDGTQFCSVADIKPFLRLNQESYEGDLPDIDSFQIAVLQHNTSYVTEKIKKANEPDKKKYIKKICAINDANTNVISALLISMQVLIKALSVIETENIRETALLNLGRHLLHVLKDNHKAFDLESLYELVKQMKQTYHERIYLAFIELIQVDDKWNLHIIKELMKDYTHVSPYEINRFDEKLAELLPQQETEILGIIKEVCSSDWSSNKFNKPAKFVTTLIDRIVFDSTSIDQDRLDVYFNISKNLDKIEREAFIHQLQKSVNKFIEAPPKPPPSIQVFDVIYNLDFTDYKNMDHTISHLFDSLIGSLTKVTDPELQKKIFEVLIKLYVLYGGENHPTN